MTKLPRARVYAIGVIAFFSPLMTWAETVAVFHDPTVAQIKFAAQDVKAALESRNFTVEMVPLSSLVAGYANKKVVIALASNVEVSKVLAAQGGSLPQGLAGQAYGLRTTRRPQQSYWALGGDANGAMYGGLQLAEKIRFEKFSGTYDLTESPAILKRGIKLNLPFDKESVTYGKSKADAVNHAILQVWDMSFWTAWFDEMARHRYNVISIWNNHPFTSLIKMPDYPDVAIQGVTDFAGKRRAMSIDEKIDFWRKVMAYAKSRGFEFYFFNWNIFTNTATGKYGITEARDEAATSPATIRYMRRCLTTLLETYPDLDGFGVTQGEHMSKDDKSDSEFLAQTYGAGMADYARAHPERRLTFVHRWHMADFSDIKRNFAELMQLPNVTFDMSYKYSKAHMYATAVPGWMTANEKKALQENGLKSWQTVRNDDFYFLNWGDPEFVRAYVNGFPGQGDWFRGFLMGSDGFSPTRTFHSKSSVTQGILEVQRQGYMFMLWGRLAYNPATSDSVFRNYLALKYPQAAAENLFAAWSKASRGLPKATELVHGTLKLDFQWWPEACQSQKGFVTAAEFADAIPGKGSTLCSIAQSAANSCAGGMSSMALADEIEGDALAALSLVHTMSAPPNTELRIALDNIKAMSYLTIYYACKIRGATHLKAREGEKARNVLGAGYWWWLTYSDLMDKMYTGMNMARSADLPHWRYHDAAVLQEYTSNGGVGIPEKPHLTSPQIEFPPR